MTKTAGQPRASSTMWGKSRDKKATRKHHTRNFGTGLIAADQHFLSRVGLRGRKRWLLLSALVLGYLLVIAHLVLTCVILGVLRFSPNGPPYFVFNNDGSLSWPEGASLTEVWLDSSVEAFSNKSLAISGENNQQVILKSGSLRFSSAGNSFVNSSQLSLSPSEARLSPFESFAVTSSQSQLLFANSSLVTMDSLSSLHQLQVANRLTTSSLGVEDGDLRVGSASGSVFMRGGNGLFVTGDHINISSGHNLELLTTYTGSLVMGGTEGVVLQGLPSQSSPPSPSYQLCACAGSRRLFLVPSNPLRCAVAVQNTGNICDS